jgi:hypothetical protein
MAGIFEWRKIAGIPHPVVASEARQSRASYAALDCFGASLLAMTAKTDSNLNSARFNWS